LIADNATPGALITRPLVDSHDLADALRARGFAPMVEPMLTITFLDATPPDRARYQGVLATSANGVRALARLAPWRDLPIWAVGDASAREARKLGFARVESASGDVAALAALVAARADPAAGPLLHVAARLLAGDLGGALAAKGFNVDKAVLYESVTAETMSPTLADALHQGRIAVALFFSPRTAATFVTLAEKAGCGESLRRIKALALSAAVAETLSSLPWRAVEVADRPDQSALLALLDGE
jgi:uroporphyrinogen-III synthase